MKREKQIYRETYKNGAYKLNQESLPVLKHISADTGKAFVAKECYLLAAGVVERDGEELEYQDLRVYLESTND